MIPKTSSEIYQRRINEIIDYVYKNNSFPTRGKNDIKFSDNSCLMGEWFKTNRYKLKALSKTNKEANILVNLSNKYMKKTDTKSINDRFNSRIREMIDFVKNNNYFPIYEDNIKLSDGSLMYIWYYTNKKRIKNLISKGDIYAKELYSLEQKYRKSKLKNKYPKTIIYQDKEYSLKGFSKYLNISYDELLSYLNVFCKDIYNIKQPELQRIKNTILNINRLKNMTSDDISSSYEKLNIFIKKYNLDKNVIINHFNKLINIGLSKEEALLSIKNEFKNNKNKVSVEWIYDTYKELDNNNIYDKNYIISYMIENNLSFNDAILKILIDTKLSNYNEADYIKKIIFYTIKSNNYEETKKYTEKLFDLDDFHIKIINDIKEDYDKIINKDRENRNDLLEELINNYDYYSLNKELIKEQYNLTKYEIMFIEARRGEKRQLRK